MSAQRKTCRHHDLPKRGPYPATLRSRPRRDRGGPHNPLSESDMERARMRHKWRQRQVEAMLFAASQEDPNDR